MSAVPFLHAMLWNDSKPKLYEIHLFLPYVGAGAVLQRHDFAPQEIGLWWPGCYGVWDGKNLTGIPTWNTLKDELVIEWSDEDKTKLDLKEGMNICPGRLITFSSERDIRKYEFTVKYIEEL